MATVRSSILGIHLGTMTATIRDLIITATIILTMAVTLPVIIMATIMAMTMVTTDKDTLLTSITATMRPARITDHAERAHLTLHDPQVVRVV